MRTYRYGWPGLLLIVLAALLLAACGGSDDTPDEAQVQDIEATSTSLFPPTWTPVPTRTEPPRVTIEYTYEAPAANIMPGASPTRAPGSPGTATPATQQQGTFPTPNASPIDDAPPSSAEQLVVSLAALNATIDEQLGRNAGAYYEAAPVIEFDGEMVAALLTVYTTPARRDTARPVVIEMSATVERGRVVLSQERVYFADDQTPYENTLAGYIMGAIETAINDLFDQQFLTVFPSGQDFTITGITFTDNAITADFSA